MTDEQEIIDLKEMIPADAGHLAEYLASGHRVLAHQMVDAIIDNTRRLEDLQLKVEAQERIKARRALR
jgi:hypothetical protein